MRQFICSTALLAGLSLFATVALASSHDTRSWPQAGAQSATADDGGSAGHGVSGAAGQDDSANNSGSRLFSLFQQIQDLQDTVRHQRGRIDELKHELQQNKQRQRDLYQDLDKRLRALEGNSGSASGGGESSHDADQSNADDHQNVVNTDSAAVKKAYEAARDELKSGNYSAASKAFQNFLKQYPDTQYSDNAWYWLGQIQYVNRQYKQSLASFQHVLKDFPDSGKVPGSLYKTGVIYNEQGNTRKARKVLGDVLAKYPDKNAARLAQKRLKALGKHGG